MGWLPLGVCFEKAQKVEVNPNQEISIEELIRRCNFEKVHAFFSGITLPLPAPKHVRLFLFNGRMWDYHEARENLPLIQKIVPGIRYAYLRELLTLVQDHREVALKYQSIAALGSTTDISDDFMIAGVCEEKGKLNLELFHAASHHRGYDTILYALSLD